MKLLLALLDSQHPDIVLAVVHTLSKIIRSERMKSSWCNFLELILLKIIDCYKIHKDVRIFLYFICFHFSNNRFSTVKSIFKIAISKQKQEHEMLST